MDPFTLFLIQLIVGIAFSVGGQLLDQTKRHDQTSTVSGVRGTLQTGGDIPLSFIMGFYGTAGSLEYIGAWGSVGGTPNAYLTKVISLSDLPVRGLSGFFVNGVRCTLGDTASGDLGLPVDEYPSKMWVRFYDGTQTDADPLLLAQFGEDPDRPWLDDMIGRGVAFAVVTALFDRDIFNGIPDYFFEIDGIELDDPRGDEAHENPITGTRTILKGLSYDGVWLYGPQNISDARLPSANWEGQMDKCDAPRSLEGGGTEPRFRFGLEVAVDQEPHAIIGEFLKACEGRIAEIGGIYKVLVGEPAAPVVSFTDEDIVISEGQSFEPFPGLEGTYNAITATYPEPEEAWESKEAPPRYRSDLETLDDGRRLPFSTDYKAVPFPVQVQELMNAGIEESRRFRRHSHTAPPEWWEYEPLDAAEWDSARNGYEGKQFLITVMDDLPNAHQIVGLQEIDPADYDWDTDLQLPYDTVVPVAKRPAPQPMTGWAASPYIITDAGSNSRRPAAEVEFAGALQDVRAVRIQVQVDSDIVFDGETPYDISEASPTRVITGNWALPGEPIKVAGKFLPFSGRETEWSAWIDVTLPDVKLGFADVEIDLDDVAAELMPILAPLQQGMRALIESYKTLGTLLEETDRENFSKRESLRRSIEVQLGEVVASFDEIIEVAAGPDGAFGAAIASLFAAMGGNTAEVNVAWEVRAAPSGYAARYAITAAVDDGVFRAGTFLIDVPSNPLLPVRIVLDADQVVISSDGGATVAALFQAGTTYLDVARIQNASITGAHIASATIDGANIKSATIDGANIKTLAVETIHIQDAAVTALDTVDLGPGSISNGASSYVTLASFNMLTAGYPGTVAATYSFQTTAPSYNSPVEVQLLVNGVAVDTDTHPVLGGAVISGTFSYDFYYPTPATVPVVVRYRLTNFGSLPGPVINRNSVTLRGIYPKK